MYESIAPYSKTKMADDDLEAIRAQRLAELQGQYGVICFHNRLNVFEMVHCMKESSFLTHFLCFYSTVSKWNLVRRCLEHVESNLVIRPKKKKCYVSDFIINLA